MFYELLCFSANIKLNISLTAQRLIMAYSIIKYCIKII